MRKADVFLHDKKAGILTELEKKRLYAFEYLSEYNGPPISVSMPIDQKRYEYDTFPPFFEGLLPEGANLEILLRTEKIDQDDFFKILVAVGSDTVGAVTIRENSQGGQDE